MRLYHSSYNHNPFRKFSRKFRREVGGTRSATIPRSSQMQPATQPDTLRHHTHAQRPSETARDPQKRARDPQGGTCLASTVLQSCFKFRLSLAMLMRTYMMNKTFVSFDTDPCASIYKLYKVSGKYSSSLGRSLRAHSRPALEFRQIWPNLAPRATVCVRKRTDGLRTPPRGSGVATHTIPAPWEDMTHLL